MHPAILARYREAPDKATRDALEQEYPGIAAEVASRPHEAAQAREMVALRKPTVTAESVDSTVRRIQRDLKAAYEPGPEPTSAEVLARAKVLFAETAHESPESWRTVQDERAEEFAEPTKKKPATKDGPRTRRVTRKPRASSKRSSRT